jgi:type II secretion system protein H
VISPSRFAPPQAAAHRSRGFTLVEVMATVVIISIFATIALPTLSRGIKDRRTRHMAEEIARVFRDARLRAVGRGSAVLVHYDSASSTFEIREAVNVPQGCSALPSTSCTLTDWAPNSTATLRSQSLEILRYENLPPSTGLHVEATLPSSAVTLTTFSVCFTPLGRSFVDTSSWPATFTTTGIMTYAPRFRVYRTDVGGSARVGLERNVILLPSGQSRLQTIGS